MKTFNLNEDFIRETNRGLCPILTNISNLEIEGLKNLDRKMSDHDNNNHEIIPGIIGSENEFNKISGLRVTGVYNKREPLQKNVWSTIKNEYQDKFKINVDKFFNVKEQDKENNNDYRNQNNWNNK